MIFLLMENVDVDDTMTEDSGMKFDNYLDGRKKL